MRFTVEKNELMDKLTPAMGTVSNKNTITSIEGVLLETLDDGRIRLSTYDMNKGIRATLNPLSTEREGKYIINAQRFYQTVRSLPDGEVTVDVAENLVCTVTCEKASFSMFAMDGADFPAFPELETDSGFYVKGSVLKKMINKVQHSVAEQDSRPMLCGAYVVVKSDSIKLVSCDSYTLSLCETKCDINSINEAEAVDCSFIIPSHALSEICKTLGDEDEEDVKINISRKHAIFKKGDIILFTRTIDSDYIDYERIIPKDNSIVINIDRERLLSGLERANIIAEEKIQGSGKSFVKLEADGQLFSLTSTSINGKVYDEMDCVHEGENIEIGFNCRYLINSIKAAEGETIKLTLKSSTMAMTIEPAELDEEFSYFYMVLPIRMNKEQK